MLGILDGRMKGVELGSSEGLALSVEGSIDIVGLGDVDGS